MYGKKITTYLMLVILLVTTASPSLAQTSPAAQPQAASNIAAIEEKLESRRKELGIPGVAMAVVHNGKIVLLKGFGYRDLAGKKPVTPDTKFAIGSATKAFTALSVLMSQDDGKLSLDDRPQKYLPFFKMSDAETDEKITIRDLLRHSSGLNRTDLAWITGRLNRREVIAVAAHAKPTAKLGEKFQYQNVMFTAAGEVVAAAQGRSWEKFTEDRIFKTLSMKNTDLSMRTMTKSGDRSLGYTYNFDTKQNNLVPYRNIDAVAPAGSINSTAADMAKWVQFVLDGGSVGGKRLVSEAGFNEWIKPQMKIGGTTSYGLGWFVQKWKDLTVVQHGGNIDGFNSMVAMIPEKKLGFVLLTNVSASSLGDDMMPVVWQNMLGIASPAAAAAVAATGNEAGRYHLAEANMDIVIEKTGEGFSMTVPGQPTYQLELESGRRYKLKGAEGFFVTFLDKELYLEQPHGNYKLPKKDAAAPTPQPADVPADLVGTYQAEGAAAKIEVVTESGRTTLNIPGQQPYTLSPADNGEFRLQPLPDSYRLRVVRGDGGKVDRIIVKQPEGEFAFLPVAKETKPSITVDELNRLAIEAAGGRAALEKIRTRISVYHADLENQGVTTTGTTYEAAPNKAANEATMKALGKTIGIGFDSFDGVNGREGYSFSPVEEYTGKRLEDARINADLHRLFDWQRKFAKVDITGTAKVDGEDAYVVVFQPEKGSRFTEYYSAATYLLLKREGTVVSSTAGVELPYSIKFEDYRTIDGIKLPFRMIGENAGSGRSVTTITSVKHNEPIADKVFAARKP